MAREMVDRLADPLLSGVYGGEAANLSVRAVLPRFAEMERTHGSLGRAMLAARKKMSAGSAKPASSLFTSLKNGMQHLAEMSSSLAHRLRCLTNTPVQAIQTGSRRLGGFGRNAIRSLRRRDSRASCARGGKRRSGL